MSHFWLLPLTACLHGLMNVCNHRGISDMWVHVVVTVNRQGISDCHPWLPVCLAWWVHVVTKSQGIFVCHLWISAGMTVILVMRVPVTLRSMVTGSESRISMMLCFIVTGNDWEGCQWHVLLSQALTARMSMSCFTITSQPGCQCWYVSWP